MFRVEENEGFPELGIKVQVIPEGQLAERETLCGEPEKRFTLTTLDVEFPGFTETEAVVRETLKSKGSGGVTVRLKGADLVAVPLLAEMLIEKVPVGVELVEMIVKVEVDGELPEVGLKVQVVEAGHPDCESVTVEAGPEAVILTVVCIPCSTFPEVGFTKTEKSLLPPEKPVKNSVIAVAPASFEVRDGRFQTVSMVFKNE